MDTQTEMDNFTMTLLQYPDRFVGGNKNQSTAMVTPVKVIPAITFQDFAKLPTEIKMMIWKYATSSLNPSYIHDLTNSLYILRGGPSIWDKTNKYGVQSPLISTATKTKVWMSKSFRYGLQFKSGGFYSLVWATRHSRQMLLEFWRAEVESNKMESVVQWWDAEKFDYVDKIWVDEVRQPLLDVLDELIAMMKGEEWIPRPRRPPEQNSWMKATPVAPEDMGAVVEW